MFGTQIVSARDRTLTAPVIRYWIIEQAGCGKNSKIKKAARHATTTIVDIKISVIVIDFLDRKQP